MSTFPYVDISHKKIWRPLSTGRYVEPTLWFLFIYFFRGPRALPSPAELRRFCASGAGPAGTPPEAAAPARQRGLRGEAGAARAARAPRR